MRIKEVKVTFEIRGADEERCFVAFLEQFRGVDVAKQAGGAGEKGDRPSGADTEDYTPGSQRTRDAFEALKSCDRVKLAKPSILEKWAKAFPDVDLAGELKKAEAWAHANNITRYPKGWARTMNSWLQRAQDSARKTIPAISAPTAENRAGLAEIRERIQGWE